jgi:rubrerythrin
MFAAIVREHLRQDIVSYEVIAEELKKRVGLELGPLSIDDIFGYKSMPPQLVCKRCKHSWTPRKQNPRVCPGCNSPYWGEDRIVR